jgi:hypothetical protein
MKIIDSHAYKFGKFKIIIITTNKDYRMESTSHYPIQATQPISSPRTLANKRLFETLVHYDAYHGTPNAS